MTEREKIISIIRPIIKDRFLLYCHEAKDCINCDTDCQVNLAAKDFADAFLSENIGDVTEWKEKVECAKRILQIPTLPNGTTDLSYFEYKEERIQDIARQRDEYRHRAEVAEKERDEWKERAEEKDKYSDILQLKSFCERNGIKCILKRRTEDFNGKLKERDGYKITFMNGDVIQSADTNGYFEFYNRHNEVDGKRIEKTKAKSFVLRYKNWLNSNNKPKREIEEEEE